MTNRLSQPATRLLNPGQLEIWTLSIDDAKLSQFRAFYEQKLSHQELKKYCSIKLSRRKNEYLLSKSCLRTLLSQYLGLASPPELDIQYTDKGKPFIDCKSAPKFSVAHSNGMFVFAFCNDMEIGVDVELINQKRNIEKIAKAVFQDSEWRMHKNADEVSHFYTLWTLKEAYLKAIGTGLSTPMKSFYFEKTAQQDYFCHHSANPDAHKFHFDTWLVKGEFCAAVGVKRKDINKKTFIKKMQFFPQNYF